MVVKVRVDVAWWLRWWLYGLITVAMLSGAKPDPEKVARVILRATRIRYVVS